MLRGYRHIKEHENEMLEMKLNRYTNREICERCGFSMKQLKNFINRFNTNQRKHAVGITIRNRERPAKDSVVTEEDKLADPHYKLAWKDARIKQLEMANELMRDFLSLTERKRF